MYLYFLLFLWSLFNTYAIFYISKIVSINEVDFQKEINFVLNRMKDVYDTTIEKGKSIKTLYEINGFNQQHVRTNFERFDKDIEAVNVKITRLQKDMIQAYENIKWIFKQIK